ncbi:hypothetical protein [Paracoccus sp. (in: a-proteobacteria)]|uniref:hypothetical protein n=1 Tax=Paracoccus sp. TaxID=267 RepID=UPI0026E08977|nr:hypothetical protein [Paracoccus sp. (in: a-proteobacteria)]MDO5647668.1 hypothetical protein [Paracoccus sp. (in: a-proteobacteria)]
MAFFMWAVGIAVFIGVVVAMIGMTVRSARGEAGGHFLDVTGPWDMRDRFYSGDVIALDRVGRRLGVMVPAGPVIVLFGDLVAVEVVQDGATVNRVGLVGQFGAATLGGVVMGPVGAVLGAASTGFDTQDRVRRIVLRVMTSLADRPVIEICVYEGEPLRAGGLVHNAYVMQADAWLDRLTASVAF